MSGQQSTGGQALNAQEHEVTSPSAPVDGAGVAAKPLPGQWIYTREWMGPFLEVVEATDKRVTCIDHGRRRFCDPAKVIAVCATKEDVQRAYFASRAVHDRRAAELADVRATAHHARAALYALEREIAAEADAAAKAEGASS